MTVQTTFLTDFNLIGYKHYKSCFECTTKLLWFYPRDQPFSILSFLYIYIYKKKKRTLCFLTSLQHPRKLRTNPKLAETDPEQVNELL